ncbi:MAG: FapA family protein, partial [Candidatus Sericytochromatia bacterium]
EGLHAQSLRDRDHGLTLECSADGLEAWLTVDPTYASQSPTKASIDELLRKVNVSFGIKPEVIDLGIKQGFLERSLVAVGEAPLAGQSARLEYLIEENDQGPAERSDGSVDYRELRLHSSVQAGSPLLRKHSAIAGEAGISIYGQSLPPGTVTDCKLLEGPGTALASDDPLLLIATRAGMPVRMASTCRVESVLELEDVGVATGNIHFDGTVVVRGFVQKGYRIEAGGDIIVHGTVEDAVLRAQGNLYLYAPVYGGAQTLLSCRYQLQGQFIQQARIECGGDLLVREALMHCQTRVVGKAIIGDETGRGLLNGGELYGTHFAQVRILGSASSTATQVALGSHPQLESHLGELEAQMGVLRQKLQENIKNMIYLRTQGGAQSERMQALEAERSRLMFESNTLTDEIQFLKDSLKQADNPKSCRIKVLDCIQPGVKVNISGAARMFDNPEPGPLSLWAKPTDARHKEVAISYT